MLEVADRITPVIGWRAWMLVREKILVSPLHGRTWVAGTPMTASCLRARHDRLPGDSCHCGIYALRTLEETQAYFKTWDEDLPLVVGQVLLWGNVIEHTGGYRAQLAYPGQLFVPRKMGKKAREELGAYYGVEVGRQPFKWAIARKIRNASEGWLHPASFEGNFDPLTTSLMMNLPKPPKRW